MIQSTYRSNFLLLGLPLVANLFPGADLGMTALAIGILIPFYNVPRGHHARNLPWRARQHKAGASEYCHKSFDIGLRGGTHRPSL